MHAMGLHSALAIKRQRRRREEQRRARERRFSSQSTESGLGESRSSCASPRNSIGSLDRRKGPHRRTHRTPQGDKVVSSVGMLHIGVVFLVLGLFLVGSGLVPDDLDNWRKSFTWINELVISGLASILVGVFLIILNKIITKKEEEDLAEYVSRQLTRSRSGHRLVRDLETGNLVSRKGDRNRSEERVSILGCEANGDAIPVHSSPALKSPPPLSASTPRSDLERILEEELSDRADESLRATAQPEHFPRELIEARYYNNIEK